MKRINFELLKNNKPFIKEKNIKCINNDKLIFIINGDKYIYYNNILEKINEDKIILDFNKEECKIYIKGYKDSLNIKIKVLENLKIDNNITIKYEIETEENVVNEIKIEYI